MDYEKQYKEALERAREIHISNDEMEYLFPELKESEDEKIRKWIRKELESKYVTNNLVNNVMADKALAWLKKQGEQKPQGKSAIKAIKEEPQVYKTKDGEIITYSETNGYKLVPKFKVKYAGSEYNVLEVKDIAGVTYYGIEDEPNHIDYVQAENCERVDGYSIKESGSPFPTKPAKFSEQNSTWSEEDEGILDEIIDFLENGTVKLQHDLSLYASWLKSLKGRVGCEVNCTTTKEWSVEDMSKIQRICKYLDEAKKYYADITEVRECIDWLKFLRPQNTWKPSEEQMYNLSEAAHYDCAFFDMEILKGLYDDLKKLREE